MAICGKWWSAFQAWNILGFRWNHFQMDRCNDQGARRSNSHWYLGGSSTGCEVKFFNLTLRAMRAEIVLKAARFSEIKGKTWDIYGKLMNSAPQFWHPCTFFDQSPRLIRRPHVQMSRALRPCLSAHDVNHVATGCRLLRPRPWRICKNHDPVTNIWQLVSQSGASKFGQKSSVYLVYLESYRKNNEFLHGDQENLELLWLFKDKDSQIHSEMAFKVERFWRKSTLVENCRSPLVDHHAFREEVVMGI